MKKIFQTCLQILALVFPISTFLPREASAKSIISTLLLFACVVMGGIIIVQNFQQENQVRGHIPEPSSLENDINAQLSTLQEASALLKNEREARHPNPAVEKILQDYQNQQIDSKEALEKIHQLNQ